MATSWSKDQSCLSSPLIHPSSAVVIRNDVQRVPHSEPYQFKGLRASKLSQLVLQILQSLDENGKVFDSQVTSVFQYWTSGQHLESLGSLSKNTQLWTYRDGVAISTISRACPAGGRYSLFQLQAPFPQTLEQLRRNVLLLEDTQDKPLTLFGGCNQTSTTLHFDRDGNYFVQLRGRKRFYLFPPQHLTDFYFFPKGHPHHRQTMVEPWRIEDITALPQFPNLRKAFGKALVANLGPGDILYIPPFWIHYVQSHTNDSLGLPLRRPEDPRITRPYQVLPLPLLGAASLGSPHALVQQYLSHIFREKRHLLDTFTARWHLAFPHLNTCNDGEFDSTEHSNGEQTRVDLLANQTLDAFSPSILTAHVAVCEYLLIEYCDDVVLSSFAQPSQAVEFILSIDHEQLLG